MCSNYEGGLDLRRVREETRGCEKIIHLNNAGAALMPAQVSDAYVHYVRAEEEEGGYEAAAKRKDDLNGFYSACAAMLNCQPDEVAFVESASRGWALAFYSLKLKAGDRIITSAAGLDGRAEYDDGLLCMCCVSSLAHTAMHPRACRSAEPRG